jgi:hypothetical protein
MRSATNRAELSTKLFLGIAVMAMAGLTACGGVAPAAAETAATGIVVEVQPTSVQLPSGGNSTFAAAVTGAVNTGVTWSVVESGGGTVDALGKYVAPATDGTYHVSVKSVANPLVGATATVTVSSVVVPPPPPPPPSNKIKLGVNIEAVAFFTKNDAFNNMMRQAGWNGGNVWETDTRDADGWPTGTSNRIVLRQSLNIQPGVYKVEFKSTASGATASITGCSMSNRVSTATTGGAYLITYDATYTTGDMVFSYANSPGGIRDLKVNHPGHAADEVLNREFVARANWFSGIRFYQSQGEEGYGVNVNMDRFWSDRRKPTFATWCAHNSMNNGIPYEGMIQMCNALNVDCYVNVPYLAVAETGVAGEGVGDGKVSTDDYLTKMAQVFKYGSDGANPYTSTQANPVWAPLKPGLKVYVEFSNELWNGSYPYNRDKNWTQAAANREIGNGNPYGYRSSGTSGYQPSASRTGRMIMKVSDVWRTVYGNEMGNTVRIVSSGFTGDDYTSQVLNYISDRRGSNPVNYYVYAFAVAPYFNQNSGTATQIIDAMAADATDTNTGNDNNGGGLVRDSARAVQFGVKMMAYEGGIGNFNIGDDAKGRAIQANDRVRTDVLKPYLRRWFADPNADTFFYYTLAKGWDAGANGYFGISESIVDESGPKWQALKEILAGQ